MKSIKKEHERKESKQINKKWKEFFKLNQKDESNERGSTGLGFINSNEVYRTARGPLSGTLDMKRYNLTLKRELDIQNAINYHEESPDKDIVNIVQGI